MSADDRASDMVMINVKDLTERLERAVSTLNILGEARGDEASIRLRGRADGLKLALSFLEEEVRRVEQVASMMDPVMNPVEWLSHTRQRKWACPRMPKQAEIGDLWDNGVVVRKKIGLGDDKWRSWEVVTP